VFTGKIRWYESFYQGKNVLLFDNSDATIPNVPKDLRLDDYYENRHADYQAFVVFPVPQPPRAFGSKYVKGAIHISFGSTVDFARIWNDASVHVVPLPAAPVPPAAAPVAAPPAAPPTVPYPEPDHMLDSWCGDLKIETALNDAIVVLGELLRGFNEVIYKSYIQPNQGD
jgi:hypothetical protein